MRILALKTFAVTIGLHYNDNNTLTALKQLTTVSMLLCMRNSRYVQIYTRMLLLHIYGLTAS